MMLCETPPDQGDILEGAKLEDCQGIMLRGKGRFGLMGLARRSQWKDHTVNAETMLLAN